MGLAASAEAAGVAKPDIDWQDSGARRAQLKELVDLAVGLLAAAGDPEVTDDPAVVEAADLLAQVIDQDVVTGGDWLGSRRLLSILRRGKSVGRCGGAGEGLYARQCVRPEIGVGWCVWGLGLENGRRLNPSAEVTDSMAWSSSAAAPPVKRCPVPTTASRAEAYYGCFDVTIQVVEVQMPVQWW
jgi:hypothetical protein